MPEESADLGGYLRAQRVFDLAGVRVQQRFLQTEGVEKQPLRQTMAADDLQGALFTMRRELNVPVVEIYQFFLAHEEEGSAVLDKLRQRFGKHRLPPRLFPGMQDCLQQIVDQFLFLVGEHRDLAQPAVMQFDASLRHATDLGVVGDDDNCVAFAVQVGYQSHHDRLVDFIEVARGLVGENQVGLVNESARNADALLFSSRQLRGQMVKAVA